MIACMHMCAAGAGAHACCGGSMHAVYISVYTRTSHASPSFFVPVSSLATLLQACAGPMVPSARSSHVISALAALPAYQCTRTCIAPVFTLCT